ncbi:hypothetical protein LTR36_008899 [Oleoguttula mirabilis]|uniref:non-specific serine/threonine protein kinase n=1 Tax=Oleoguttula mirabilis TaxID=1507867 RepID=A0AAV9J7E5_9PEZI|nr:hypothetical protein LTR36_008899 [Oleoguttula mirabilis]
MDSEDLTQCTQGLMDPRRMGRNNSGMSEADISDVMCILHPCSPAAFQIVATTAELAPQNVLQNDGFGEYDDGLTQSVLEEQETFILNSDVPNQAMDLALRFTADIINPTLGFVFGRNGRICDIVLATDTYKRVSNMHFSIFVNESGVLMLRDMSTNGTMVDDIILKGKAAHEPQTRMLNPGSIIQILSPKPEEIVKFIVRIPSREGHIEEYESKFQTHMRRVGIAGAAMAKESDVGKRLAIAQSKTQTGSYKGPLVHHHYGMHWGGGDKYNVVGLIGKGAFATVYQLATKSEGQLFAAKELEKRKFMKNGVLDRKLSNEMEIMKAISHPNIVRYVDYQDVANNLYIIMEFVPCGDLQQYLANNGPLTEDLGKKMAVQVLDSLAYLHSVKITHRDIKPDNILLANLDPDHFTIKLSDFGLSKVVKDNDTFLKTFCGTLLYCAPEVFPHYDAHVAGRGQKRARKGTAQQPSKFHSYSQSVDIWSFGAVLWYALCVKPPFEGVADNTGRGMFEKIMMTPLDPADLVKQGVSDDAVALLADMLNTDPASRPLPSYCLRHRWFGVKQPATAGATSPELGLRVIAEEEDEEAEAGAEPDFSQLSLNERDSGGSEDSLYDEASIHSGSMDFFDPRQSKRFKSEAFAYREQDQGQESSPELLHQSLHFAQLAYETPSDSRTPYDEKTQHYQESQQLPGGPIQFVHQPDSRKLFGEISQSDLGDGTLGMRANEAPGNNGNNGAEKHSQGSDGGAQQTQLPASRGAMASPSLLGAESLLRDVHMDSPQATDSPAAESNEPRTPQTSGDSHAHAAGRPNGTPNVHDDITPKQAQHSTFNRQINIPITASFFYDPGDYSTHTPEYASKISGFDFVSNPSYLVPAEVSLPATTSGSATDNDHDDHHDDTDAEQEVPALLPPPPEFVKPPPRLGRLVSTPDSFAQVTLNLSKQITTWGRASTNTYVYPDKNDTRVPKRGIILYFHAKGIDKASEASDWTKLPGLHCGIATESSAGIYVNGVELKKGDFGRMKFGRVYTGDEVMVSRAGLDGKPGLKFRCEFFHGEGREKRPEGCKFKVETEGAQGRSYRSQGKEQENVLVAEKAVAA